MIQERKHKDQLELEVYLIKKASPSEKKQVSEVVVHSCSSK